MAMEPTPIDHFVAQQYAHPAVQKIVEVWRVEPKDVIDHLIDYFRDMGVYVVAYGHEKLVLENMLRHLRNGPEIQKLVARARSDEARRARNRHAD